METPSALALITTTTHGLFALHTVPTITPTAEPHFVGLYTTKTRALAEARGLKSSNVGTSETTGPKHTFQVVPAYDGHPAHVFAVATADPKARPQWVGSYETTTRAQEEVRYLTSGVANGW